MKAVILAAGLGSRLRPITYKKPKSLTKIYNITILERQIKNLERCGIDEIFIITGYRAKDFKRFNLEMKFKKLKIHFIENMDYEISNNMYSLYLAKNFLYQEDFLLCNGDIVFEENIIRKLMEYGDESAVAVDTGTYLKESMKICIDEQGDICDISKEISEDIAHGSSIDIYKFSSCSSRILFDEIDRIINEEKNMKDWTEIALQRLFKSKKIVSKPLDIKGYKWVEIDDYDDLLQADFTFSDIHVDFDQGTFFIDIDGTLFIGDKMVKGADKFIDQLKKNASNYYLLSNNSSYSPTTLRSKLLSMGIDVPEERIILSTQGLIKYLIDEGLTDTHVMGTQAMKDMMKKQGIETDAENPECLVLGYDTELTYDKLKRLCEFLNMDKPLFATHCDITCPTLSGPVPDIGSLLALLELVTNKKAIKIFGKPNPEMVDYILHEQDVTDKSKVYVMGDRVYTDMKMARSIGAKFICVLSGETKREDIEELQDYPDLIISKVSDLIFTP